MINTCSTFALHWNSYIFFQGVLYRDKTNAKTRALSALENKLESEEIGH